MKRKTEIIWRIGWVLLFCTIIGWMTYFLFFNEGDEHRELQVIYRQANDSDPIFEGSPVYQILKK